MEAQEKVKRAYRTRLHEAAGGGDLYRFTFKPRGLQQALGNGSRPKRAPEYSALVREQGGETTFNWEGEAPSDPDAGQEDFRQYALDRLRTRKEWLARVVALVDTVEGWAGALGWATRRVEKRVTDEEIGNHTVPALQMQDGVTRALLEPVSRWVPGADGLVDLYLMPAYADIASLYFREGGWQLHYAFPGSKAVATVKDAEPRPLTREALAAVLEGMKAHAG